MINNIKDTLTMESGKDIDIKGSKAGGKKVEIKTGNNLSIESLQDSHAYHSRDKESGIYLQRDRIARPDTGKKKMDDPYFSIGKKTDTTDSTYESVTKQAGIYAGKEGYDIQVKNNTRLKGAVIDSQAEKEKNRLTTGTLTWENIENKAEYKTGGHGISYNGKIGRGDKNDPLDSQTNNRYGKDAITGQRNGMNKITPTIYGSKIPLNERGILNTPVPSVKGKAGTTTRSAVSKGTITITDKENRKQDIEKLNRNTEDSLNKLKEIFDKTKVEEKQELIHMMNIVGNQIIHEAADHYGWKEGSTEKLLLHGAIGALTGTMSGGNALSGAVSGSVNEFALAYMEKTKGRDWMDTHPDTVQAISTALGAVAGSLTGDRNTGAYTAQMGTWWNGLRHKDQAYTGEQDGAIENQLSNAVNEGDKEKILGVLLAAYGISVENNDIPESAENDFIYTFNSANNVLGTKYTYDSEIGMTQNLQNAIERYNNSRPDRDIFELHGGIGVGYGIGIGSAKASSGVQANVHLDFSTSRDHPVIVANASTSIIAVGGQIGYIYDPKYHTSDGSVNAYGALRGINISNDNGDSVADFGVQAYYGAGAEVGVRVNLSKLYEEIFHEREDTNKKEDIKRRVNEITDKRRN